MNHLGGKKNTSKTAEVVMEMDTEIQEFPILPNSFYQMVCVNICNRKPKLIILFVLLFICDTISCRHWQYLYNTRFTRHSCQLHIDRWQITHIHTLFEILKICREKNLMTFNKLKSLEWKTKEHIICLE